MKFPWSVVDRWFLCLHCWAWCRYDHESIRESIRCARRCVTDRRS